MRVIVIGHAGLLIETSGGSIACDPWFEPAFFGSWFVFPRNDRLDADLMARITKPDYLYISHLHADHLDEPFLRERMDKDVTVLLPGFPLDELEQELRRLGFHRFITTKPSDPVVLADGLEVRILTETAIADGPGGDSTLIVSDGRHTVVNQNDCRPHDFAAMLSHGTPDLHVIQYSGAIWYPLVYEYPAEELARLGAAKREAQFARALRYVRELDAAMVVPAAGPPCFLDPELFAVNDLDGDPSSIFPDQTVFLDRMASEGISSGQLAIPGTVIELGDGPATVTQPCSQDELEAIYADKRSYLTGYQADMAGWLAAEHASWSPARPDLVGRLAQWIEPLMAVAPRTRAGIGAAALLRIGDEEVLLDFPAGRVRPYDGEDYDFRFTIARELIETLIDRRPVDWSNAFFLSCRFSAWRKGAYNEYLYNFFKSMSPERMARAEAQAEADGIAKPLEEVRVGDWMVERWCPHRQADLAVFGSVDGDTLTCNLHGWKFDLTTGNCLTSDRHLRCRPASEVTAAP